MTTNFLGANVYLWSRTAQDRFLVECLRPAIRELQAQGQAGGFWFDRFDARGPHLFFLLRSTEDLSLVRRHLSQRLESFLAIPMDGDEIPVEEIEERHRQVLGRVVCEADELPGIAANHSFVLFEHPADSYPFRVMAHLDDPHEFWHLWEDLSSWSLQQIGASAEEIRAIGVRWAVALDRCLRNTGGARDFWRHHAETLLPGILVGTEPEKLRILAYLASAVGARNRDTFARVWKETSPSPWPQLSRLVEAGLVIQQPDRRFLALREAMHCTWKQLGIPVHLEIPLVLFAWGRG